MGREGVSKRSGYSLIYSWVYPMNTFTGILGMSGNLAMNWKIFHIFAPRVPFLWVPRLDFYSDIPEIPRPIWEYPKLQVYPEYRLLPDISG